ncbi:MAG: hypothetical protein AMJ43_05620 [Coxiella sp. DG_40]|nr:MAG: hypothetical protein AMJ43_05620 [Coxiella sp. DG_40]
MRNISGKTIIFAIFGIIANYTINALLDEVGFHMWLANIFHSTNTHIFFWGITSTISIVILFIMFPYVFKEKKQSNVNEEKKENFLICITNLLEYLQKYDYDNEYIVRTYNVILNTNIHNWVTISYETLEKLRKSSLFLNEKLANLLKQFLSYFEYWSCFDPIFKKTTYNIKPIFKSRNEFKEHQIKIENLVKKITDFFMIE